MTDAQKIQLADKLIELCQSFTSVTSEDMPVMVGTLTAPFGIRGFVSAYSGHPVFEFKDRYVLYLTSEYPGEKTGQHTTVAVQFNKETLEQHIEFLPKK